MSVSFEDLEDGQLVVFLHDLTETLEISLGSCNDSTSYDQELT